MDWVGLADYPAMSFVFVCSKCIQMQISWVGWSTSRSPKCLSNPHNSPHLTPLLFLFIICSLGAIWGPYVSTLWAGQNPPTYEVSCFLVTLFIREGSKKIKGPLSRLLLLKGGGGGSADMSRPIKLFYGLKWGKKGHKMVLHFYKTSSQAPRCASWKADKLKSSKAKKIDNLTN